MKLTLETTTGLLVPGGVAPPLSRGSEKILLRFVTNGVAALLPDDTPIALKLWLASVADDPIATLAAWTTLTADVAYRATVDARTIAELAWLQSGVLIGRVDYGDPVVQSAAFQINYGAGTAAGGSGAPQIVITQPAGPVKITPHIGYFQGKLVADQVEGRWVANAACQLTGFDLHAQVSPDGADVIVEAVLNGVPTGKVSTLPDGSKGGYSAFAAPLAVAIGDVVQFKPTQVGTNRPGTYLSVGARGELV